MSKKAIEHRENKKYIGTHIVADFWGCRYKEDPAELLSLLIEAANASNAEVLDTAVHDFTPGGITAILLLAESHISIHTWPEYNFVAIDVFTCGHDMEPRLAIQHLEKKLKPSETLTRIIKRGEIN